MVNCFLSMAMKDELRLSIFALPSRPSFHPFHIPRLRRLGRVFARRVLRFLVVSQTPTSTAKKKKKSTRNAAVQLLPMARCIPNLQLQDPWKEHRGNPPTISFESANPTAISKSIISSSSPRRLDSLLLNFSFRPLPSPPHSSYSSFS